VYTLEGTLVGDGAAFIDHMKHKYGLSMNITKETIKARQRLNVEETEERMRKM
jgi:hypothetical protein